MTIEVQDIPTTESRAATAPTQIAFIGTGAMGQRMAARLLGAGHRVTVWNRSPGPLEALSNSGAWVAETPKMAAMDADLVLSMITDDSAARSVWLGEDGALAGMKPGALAVEMSTVSGEWIAELAAATQEKDVRFLDAPVAGSRPHAEGGTLAFLAGGAAEDVATFDPVARAMGQAVIHAGGAGKGAALKMMVNGLLAVQTAALAELLAYGEAEGIQPSAAMDLLSPIPVTSPAAQVVGRQIAEKSHAPMFTVDLLVKDLGYLLDGHSAPVMEAVIGAFRAAQARGNGDLHISAVAA